MSTPKYEYFSIQTVSLPANKTSLLSLVGSIVLWHDDDTPAGHGAKLLINGTDQGILPRNMWVSCEGRVEIQVGGAVGPITFRRLA